jgi:hypothetical protein
MGGNSPLTRTFVAATSTSPMRLVVDVGGGRGRLLEDPRAVPRRCGILFDQFHVIEDSADRRGGRR